MVILLLYLFPFKTFAQNLTVSGIVKDEKGAAMPGVTVSVKGTAHGMSTDPNGKYSISAEVAVARQPFLL